MSCDHSWPVCFLQIARREEVLLGNAKGPNHVYIDSSAGNETVFRFTWEKGEARALLRGPSGAILQSSECTMDADMESKVVEIRVMGTAEVRLSTLSDFDALLVCK